MNRALLVLLCLCFVGCQSLKKPEVWGPVVLAAALQINDLDEQLSDDLASDTPVFGSQEDAGEASGDLLDFTQTSYLAAGLFIPNATQGPLGKTVLLGGQYLSVQVVEELTAEMKDAVGRERPNGANKKSMPSGHMTEATYQASLARHNISYLGVSDGTKTVFNYVVTGSAVMTGYARVEAGQHYISDVLVSWSLGTLYGDAANMITPTLSRDHVGMTYFLNF
jgi:hypothetical protein